MKLLKSILANYKKTFLLFIIIYTIFYTLQTFTIGTFSSFFDGRIASSSLLLVLTSLLFSSTRKFFYSSLLLGILTSSLICLKLFIDGSLEYIFFNRTLGYIIGSINILLIFSALVIKNNVLKHFIFPSLLIILLPIIFIWAYYFTSHNWINIDTILAILQTNFNEAQEYIYHYATPYSFLCLIISLVILFGISHLFLSKLETVNLTKPFLYLTTLCLIGNIILVYKCRDNLITTVFHEAQRYTSTYNDFNKLKDIRKSKLMLSGSLNEGIYVLVIGESHSRDFSSAYDYEPDTNPWLKTVSKQNNAVLLKNAYSCHVQTTPSVTYAMTAKNQYNSLSLKDSLSLLEVVEQAGFDTVWLSNQSKFGFNDTPITVIADEANQQFWINGTKLRVEQKAFDEELLHYIPKISMKKNMLIIIHLMGSHASYKHRYPKHFAYFGEDTEGSEYNNAIRYTDYVLESIYNTFKNIPSFQAMMYFSDHGEKLGVGHNTSNFDKCMSNIPVCFIFSDSYIKHHKQTFNTLLRNKDYIFTNDLIFNTVLGTMGINIKNLNEPHNDLSNNSYDFNPKRFTTMYGKVKIID